LIHRQHLSNNLGAIRQLLAPGTEVCAAVKADAYGHSAALVVPWLAQEGVGAFGVATVAEGTQLRQAGIRQPVLLLGSLQPDELAEAVESDLDLFVWTEEAIARAAAAARGRATQLRVHLKIDTGMGRVGCRPEAAEDLASAIVHSLPLELTGVCTHLAASDGPGPLGVETQLGRFSEALATLRARGWTPRFVHAANSGGITAWPSSHFNLARPGIALYGYPPAPESGTGRFQPVMELVSRVGYVKTVPKGTFLSYGSRYQTTTETDIATIPLGYADGYRRAFSNRAPLWIAGRGFQVSGTVCMDQFLVDLGPHSGIQAGDEVVLFGPPRAGQGPPPPTAETLASLADSISYEILCGISARVPRVGV